MSDQTDREDALARLKDLCEPNAQPEIEEADLEAILDRHLRLTTRLAGKSISVGQRIRPTIANGREYVATQSGVTGSTEPEWPKSIRPGSYPKVTDGSVVFEDDGDMGTIYDVYASAQEVWSKKCALASEFVSTPGIDMAGIYKRCVDMRDSFQQVCIG